MQIMKWFSNKIYEINLYELLIYSRNKRYYFVDDVSRFKTESNISSCYCMESGCLVK